MKGYLFTKISKYEYDLIVSEYELSDDKRRVDFDKYYVMMVVNVFSDLYHCLIIAKRKGGGYLIDINIAFDNFKQQIEKLIEKEKHKMKL